MIETKSTTETVKVTKDRLVMTCDRCGTTTTEPDDRSGRAWPGPPWAILQRRTPQHSRAADVIGPGDVYHLCHECFAKIETLILLPLITADHCLTFDQFSALVATGGVPK